MFGDPMETESKKPGAQSPPCPEADYYAAMYRTADGKHGIPAGSFRCAMISACRVAGYVMTKAKLSVFVVTPHLDDDDKTPLVLIDGTPRRHDANVRLESGVASISIRPMWVEWSATLTVKWDGDQFSENDVINLLERAGQQVGIGEGRPDSKKSNGMGWGTFTLLKEDN